MRKLLGSDALYAAVVRPEIDGVLAANGIEGSDVPKSIFLPDETRWLDEAEVSAALGSVSGSSGGSVSGVHGLGLIGTSVNGTELAAETDHLGGQRRHARKSKSKSQTRANRPRTGSTSRSASAAARPSRARSTASAPGKSETVSIPLTPAPSGEVTLEVKVDTVPGEKVSENNEASYTVAFE